MTSRATQTQTRRRRARRKGRKRNQVNKYKPESLHYITLAYVERLHTSYI
jgi:hypothetical protein